MLVPALAECLANEIACWLCSPGLVGRKLSGLSYSGSDLDLTYLAAMFSRLVEFASLLGLFKDITFTDFTACLARGRLFLSFCA